MSELSAVANAVALEELLESVGGDQGFFAELVDDVLAGPATQHQEALATALGRGAARR